VYKPLNNTFIEANHVQEIRQANELREKELKEKIKKMRSSKSGPSDVQANRG